MPLPPLVMDPLPSEVDVPASSATVQPVLSLPPAPPRAQTIDCLVAGRNPIVTKVLETMLIRLGCRVVVVPNGAEAILAAGGVRFDIIFMDLAMPVVDGEKAARMIKSTTNPSQHCPIVAVCSYTAGIDDEVGTLFSGILQKPVLKAQLLATFDKLGFERRVKDERRASGGQLPLSAIQMLSQPEERRSSA